jgi:hypothetical protein
MPLYRRKETTMDRISRTAALALGFYLVWSLATWWFEGRIATLLRPDAVQDRLVYAFGVNLLLGVVGGAWLLRRFARDGLLEPARAGLRAGRKTPVAILAGLALGLAAYFLQGAPSSDPIVLANAFSQVLVVSAAEVIVCWSIVGVAVEAALVGRLGRLASWVAALVASALFGLYHYAHSAPFDTLPMVALLSAVGLVTSAFFFASRDVAATIVFHNFLGTFGVVQALAAAKALQPLQSLQPPLLFTAGVTLVAVAAGYVWVGRGVRPPRPALNSG